jgi:hypothetical protein
MEPIRVLAECAHQLSRAGLEDAERAVGAGSKKLSAEERNIQNLPRVTFQLALTKAGCAIVAGGGQGLAIGREGQADNEIGVLFAPLAELA